MIEWRRLVLLLEAADTLEGLVRQLLAPSALIECSEVPENGR